MLPMDVPGIRNKPLPRHHKREVLPYHGPSTQPLTYRRHPATTAGPMHSPAAVDRSLHPSMQTRNKKELNIQAEEVAHLPCASMPRQGLATPPHNLPSYVAIVPDPCPQIRAWVTISERTQYSVQEEHEHSTAQQADVWYRAEVRREGRATSAQGLRRYTGGRRTSLVHRQPFGCRA